MISLLRYLAWYLKISITERLFGAAKTDLFLEEKYTRLKDYYASDVLDVGSGHGDYARMLKEDGLTVSCIDVVNRIKYPDLPFRSYNGLDIPFPDKAFRTSLAMFILHHADDQVRVLSEMARVTEGHLLIGEDVLETRLDRVFAEAHIRSSQWSQGSKGFHTHPEWLEIFGGLGLELVDMQIVPRYKEPIYPVSRRIYVLKTR